MALLLQPPPPLLLSCPLSWYLLHTRDTVLGAFADHLAPPAGSRYHLALTLLARALNERGHQLRSGGRLRDGLSFTLLSLPFAHQQVRSIQGQYSKKQPLIDPPSENRHLNRHLNAAAASTNPAAAKKKKTNQEAAAA